MYGFIWTSIFGIRSLTRSTTYTTSTRAISLGVVFMKDFRSDPNENKSRNPFRAKFFLQNLLEMI